MFGATAPGSLVSINGTDARSGTWTHSAFSPDPLPNNAFSLEAATYLAVSNARAALAALDSTASRLPNPRLFRRPALQTEAQSTSALEGTYAPLDEVLKADEDKPPTADLKEILNYVTMGNMAYSWIEAGRNLTVGLLEELQSTLVKGTKSDNSSAGRVRDHIVVIGRRSDALPDDAPVHASRFVPPPPGPDLRARLQDLVDWINAPHGDFMDPVIAAALAHYQFETLHPFNDGNGRIGRLLIVIHLYKEGVLSEPTLTVSPWFEARRSEYYDRLLGVSTDGLWDRYIQFFAAGLRASANSTHDRMLALIDVQRSLKETVRRSNLRADTAMSLIDYAVGHPTFTVRAIEKQLNVSYGRANGLVGQLVELDILSQIENGRSERRFFAPEVLRLLTRPLG